jgi:hypothetical protein
MNGHRWRTDAGVGMGALYADLRKDVQVYLDRGEMPALFMMADDYPDAALIFDDLGRDPDMPAPGAIGADDLHVAVLALDDVKRVLDRRVSVGLGTFLFERPEVHLPAWPAVVLAAGRVQVVWTDHTDLGWPQEATLAVDLTCRAITLTSDLGERTVGPLHW